MEEPKSKRENVDEEQKLMSPNEKRTLQGTRHSFDKENSSGKALNEG